MKAYDLEIILFW